MKVKKRNKRKRALKNALGRASRRSRIAIPSEDKYTQCSTPDEVLINQLLEIKHDYNKVVKANQIRLDDWWKRVMDLRERITTIKEKCLANSQKDQIIKKLREDIIKTNLEHEKWLKSAHETIDQRKKENMKLREATLATNQKLKLYEKKSVCFYECPNCHNFIQDKLQKYLIDLKMNWEFKATNMVKQSTILEHANAEKKLMNKTLQATLNRIDGIKEEFENNVKRLAVFIYDLGTGNHFSAVEYAFKDKQLKNCQNELSELEMKKDKLVTCKTIKLLHADFDASMRVKQEIIDKHTFDLKINCRTIKEKKDVDYFKLLCKNESAMLERERVQHKKLHDSLVGLNYEWRFSEDLNNARMTKYRSLCIGDDISALKESILFNEKKIEVLQALRNLAKDWMQFKKVENCCLINESKKITKLNKHYANREQHLHVEMANVVAQCNPSYAETKTLSITLQNKKAEYENIIQFRIQSKAWFSRFVKELAINTQLAEMLDRKLKELRMHEAEQQHCITSITKELKHLENMVKTCLSSRCSEEDAELFFKCYNNIPMLFNSKKSVLFKSPAISQFLHHVNGQEKHLSILEDEKLNKLLNISKEGDKTVICNSPI